MDNSPLGKLPPEIRNQIYELVLHTGTIHVLLRDIDSAWEASPNTLGKHHMALTRVCKAARRETNGTCFAVNTFSFSGTTLADAYLAWRSFGTSLAAHDMEALRSVRLEALAVSCDCLERASTCEECTKIITALKGLYEWSLMHPKVSVVAEESYTEEHSAGVELCYSIPLDLKNITTAAGKDAVYLYNYRAAYQSGIDDGHWAAWKSLIGLKVPTDLKKTFVEIDVVPE